VLGSPLIVILAHTTCGAVKAACDVVTKNATYPGAIGPMIEPILPAVLAVRNDPGDFVNNAAKESARRTAGRLTTASTLIAGLAGDTLHLNNLPQAFFKNLPTAFAPIAIGAALLRSRQRCSHFTAELTLTSKHSAASRRDAPVSTASITRSRRLPTPQAISTNDLGAYLVVNRAEDTFGERNVSIDRSASGARTRGTGTARRECGVILFAMCLLVSDPPTLSTFYL
jgi:hypothetical protein